MGFENMENYIIFPLNTVNVVSMKQNKTVQRKWINTSLLEYNIF